jgi:hypothetical protein
VRRLHLGARMKRFVLMAQAFLCIVEGGGLIYPWSSANTALSKVRP